MKRLFAWLQSQRQTSTPIATAADVDRIRAFVAMLRDEAGWIEVSHAR